MGTVFSAPTVLLSRPSTALHSGITTTLLWTPKDQRKRLFVFQSKNPSGWKSQRHIAKDRSQREASTATSDWQKLSSHCTTTCPAQRALWIPTLKTDHLSPKEVTALDATISQQFVFSSLASWGGFTYLNKQKERFSLMHFARSALCYTSWNTSEGSKVMHLFWELKVSYFNI